MVRNRETAVASLGKRLLGALALTAAGLAPNLNAQGELHELQLVVWGTDGTIQADAVVAARDDGGVMVKATPLPSGGCTVEGVGIKTLIEVDHATLGSVQFEVLMPRRPVVLADVLYIEPGVAEILIDQPTKSRRTTGFTSGEPPANDLCEDAQYLPVPVVLMGTTIDATIDEFTGCDSGGVTSPGVWYTVFGTGNSMMASTCGEFFDYDTKITIFCASCTSETCIAGNDDSCANGANPTLSTVYWCSEPGVPYNILVHGFGGQSGNFELRVLDNNQPCTPEVICTATGACCLPSGECANGMTQADCEALNGYYQGDDVDCEGSFLEYAPQPCDLPFEDIRDIGIPGPTGDDADLLVPFGFEFRFWDRRYVNALMSTNGYLTFDADGTDFSNDPCPDPEQPNDAIFGLWTDLVIDGPGQTDFLTLGTAPNRRFIAQWTNVRKFMGPQTETTFQVVLQEGTNEIFYRYLLLDGIPSMPDEARIGVENYDGTEALCISDTAIQTGECWRIYPAYGLPVECPCRFIDFETEDDFTTPLVNGQHISSPPGFGHLFMLNGYGAGSLGTAVFDSDPSGPNGWGPDPDLLVDMGNVVMLQALDEPDQTVPGIFDVPDDCETGGVYTIEFLEPVEPRRLDFVDIDEGDFHTQVFLTDCYGAHRTYLIPGGWTTDIFEEGPPGYGTLYLDTLLPQPGENGSLATVGQQAGFDPYNVVYIEIHMGNSGAIDNFEFCISQQPDSLP